MRRFVVGGDGSFDLFGKNWNWESYFQHGETDTSIKIYNMPLSGAPVNAGDLAPAPTASSRASTWRRMRCSIASGQIVCRNTIAQAYGCVPFNPFGGDTHQPRRQIAYFDNQNGPGGTTIGPTAIMTNARKPSASRSMVRRSTAGPVRSRSRRVTNIAKSITRQRADPYSAGVTRLDPGHLQRALHRSLRGLRPDHLRLASGAWNAGNYHNGRGTYHVNEVFVEFGIPLLNDDFWGKIDLDIAGRHARYSHGRRRQHLEGRCRPGKRRSPASACAPCSPATFAPPTCRNCSRRRRARTAASTTTSHRQTAASQNDQSGRERAATRSLKPEKAQTTEVGIVWQPDFIPGFQASIDYYRIARQGRDRRAGFCSRSKICASSTG